MRRVLAVVAVLLATSLPSLATSIGDILGDPQSYAKTDVTVVGTVTAQRLGYAGESVYTLSGDADGERITVFSRRTPPAEGDRLEVKATVGFKAPDEEFTWPPILLEHERQATP